MGKEFSFIIIDDSELDRFVIQKVIGHTYKNLDVKTFQDAQLALEVIRGQGVQNHPTVILVDIQMPLMDGFQFIEEFETLPADVKSNYTIIILSILSTARSPAHIYMELNKSKVKSIIEKPFTIEKLVSLLKEIGLSA